MKTIMPAKVFHLSVDKILVFAIFAFIIGFSLIRGFLLSEIDPVWQARAGQDTLASGMVPSVDTWNWMVLGNEWLTNSWLWNVILALCFNVAGSVGIALFTAIISAATLLLVWKFIIISNVKNRFTQFFIILAVIVALAIWLSGRAQQADYLILIFFYLLVLMFKKFSFKIRIFSLTGTALIFSCLWMNLHLTAPLGVSLFAAGYWFISIKNYKETFLKRTLTTAAITVGGLAGLLITPYGLDGVLKTLLVVNESRGIITEWMVPNLNELSGAPSFFALILFGIGAIALAIWKKQWLLTAVLIVLTYLSYDAIRFVPFLVLFALINVSALPEIRVPQKKLVAGLLVATSSLILIFGLGTAVNHTVFPEKITPLNPSSFDAVPKNSRLLTLFNGGGTVLLFRQDVSPSTDGRNDLLGRELVLEITDLYLTEDTQKVENWLNKEEVGSVFVENGRSYNMSATMQILGWKRIVVPDGELYLRK
jgi:hypothetical protein